MKHLSLALVALGSLAAATACRSTDEPEATYEVTAPNTMTLEVSGMT